jgi:hypothetical protein
MEPLLPCIAFGVSYPVLEGIIKVDVLKLELVRQLLEKHVKMLCIERKFVVSFERMVEVGAINEKCGYGLHKKNH